MASSTWLAHSGENVASTAASVALAVLTAEHIHVHGLWPTAGLAGVYAVLYSVATRRVKNGTDSFNPNVVDKRQQPW